MDLESFVAYRPLLFTIAYEITGSASDAEDVLQDSRLRWSEVEVGTVENPRAYLARIVARQALNLLRAHQRRRETYVGPWRRDRAHHLVPLSRPDELAGILLSL